MLSELSAEIVEQLFILKKLRKIKIFYFYKQTTTTLVLFTISKEATTLSN